LGKLKTFFNWSTGKDSAMALYRLQQDPRYNVERLITTVNQHHDRVTMHGLRRDLLLKQVMELDIPSSTIELPEQPDMATYESLMGTTLKSLKDEGFDHAAFGDIFLQDLKTYRERQMAGYGLKTIFPLWQKDSKTLLQEFIDLGFKAILVCVDAKKLDASFAGRIIDERFIADLPDGVDPCGENGEYHTFCFDGPIFKKAIPFQIGERIYREYDAPSGGQKEEKAQFWFCDLLVR
jgi:uncharacterized protein (TIGR00290 family)